MTSGRALSGGAPSPIAALDDCVSALGFSPDGEMLAMASLGGEIAAVDVASGRSQPLATRHAGGALTLAWSPAGDAWVSGGQDGVLALHRLDGSAQILQTGADWVEHVAWSPDGDFLAVAAGRRVRFLSSAGEVVSEVDGHDSTVTGIVWSSEPGVLMSCCYGGVNLLGVRRSKPVRRLRWKGSILALALSPNGRWIATGNQDASVHVWHVASGRDFEMSGFPAKVRTLRFRPDSQSLATASGASVALWDFSGRGPAGRAPKVLEGHRATVTDVAFVTDLRGKSGLLTTSLDGTLCSWVPAQSRKALGAVRVAAPVTRLAVHPSGILALGTRDGAVHLSTVGGVLGVA